MDSDVIMKYSDSSYYRVFDHGQGTVGNRIPSFFMQDSWEINNSLQLNAGLRWEGQYIINSNGSVSQKILDQFQPRIGLIFLPEQNDHQKIFATYGRFYHDLNLKAVQTFYTYNYISAEVEYDHDPRFKPTGGDTIYVLYGQSQKSIDNMQGQYDDEFTLGYEQMILFNHKVSVHGVYRTLGNGIDDAYSSELGKFVLGNPGSVGNVWEWVGEPYAEGQAGSHILRGGRYGLPINDLSYRLSVAPDNTRYLKYTGFRWAADQVK